VATIAGIASLGVVLITTSTRAQPVTPSGAADAPPSGPACIPDCRKGFLCVEGRCVSACNPPCGADETCTEARECAKSAPATPPPSPPTVAPAPAPAPPPSSTNTAAATTNDGPKPTRYPYDQFRIALGGGVGLGVVPDGTGFPFSFLGGLAFPLGGHFFLRSDIAASYFSTSANASYDVGSGPRAQTYVDSTHFLAVLRLMAGYQMHPLVSLRAGPLVGYRTLYVEQGICGVSYAEKEFSGAAFGGAAAFALHAFNADFALQMDAYSAKTQGYCAETTTGKARSGTLVGTEKLGMQFLLQGSYLF